MLKFVTGLQDCISYKVKFSKDKMRAWLGQPHLITNMEKKFGELVQNVWSHKTAGTPTFLIIRPMVNSQNISMKDQEDHWLGIGMLLYLVKHLCPDLANTTRVLSKPCCLQ